jgi:hypothetical protein
MLQSRFFAHKKPMVREMRYREKDHEVVGR